MSSEQEKRLLLRHIIATLAYRATKIFRNAPEGFSSFEAGEEVRTPLAIVGHLNLLLDYSKRNFDTTLEPFKPNRSPTWEGEVALFYILLRQLDETVASGTGPRSDISVEQIIQGHISDAMTHIGQLATLRRLAGAPIKGESYWKADIQVGHVGPDQPLQTS